MIETHSQPQHSLYEQAILRILRSLPLERLAQVLDFAMFVKSQPSTITPPNVVIESDERVWGQAAIQSLSKYWDTPEEDEAWQHLQKAT
jgi:hypothetical protein